MKITEDEIRKITLNAINELGDKATPDLVRQVVSKSVETLEGTSENFEVNNSSSGRIILTSFGLNKPGIVAALTDALGKANCDIQDLTQKIMGEFFTIIMVVDIETSEHDLKEIQNKMNNIADELKIKIYLQHEDLFRQMHRI